jgi:hypothetical protein
MGRMRTIDLDREGADDAAFLQPPQPLGDARRGQADMGGEVLQRDARIPEQRFEDALVDIIEHFIFLGEVAVQS